MTVLLVDDEKQVLDGMLHGIDFTALGIDTVLTARSGEDAKEIIIRRPVNILIADIEMADLSGLSLLEWIRDENYPIRTIFCTAFRRFDYAKKALELHAFDYFLKPIRYDELSRKLAAAMDTEPLIFKPAMSPEQPSEASPRKIRTAIQTVCDYIDAHLDGEITRAELAKMVYMNPDYLGTVFKEEMHCSITIYIQNKRLTRAKELLTTTDYPISKVAEMVGYDNISYFSKLFRQKVGCQPGEYRKNGEAAVGAATVSAAEEEG